MVKVKNIHFNFLSQWHSSSKSTFMRMWVGCSAVYQCFKCFPGSTLCIFGCFAALRPKSTAMVMVGQSVHLATLFPGQA